MLFSASWDKTVRVSDLFAKSKNTEVLEHNSEVLSIALRSDGQQLLAATLKGEIYIWNVRDGQIVGVIGGVRDLQGGRLQKDRVTAKNSQSNKHFRSVQYSSDGEYILAGGNSKFVCLFDIRHRILLKKFRFTQNRSLDGVLQKLNSKLLGRATEGSDWSESGRSDDERAGLPTARSFDVSKRRDKKVRVECREIRFSPAEDQWCMATSEGLVIYA